jgi:hypothetical protein
MEHPRILVVRHAEPVAATVDGPAEALRPLTGRGRRAGSPAVELDSALASIARAA